MSGSLRAISLASIVACLFVVHAWEGHARPRCNRRNCQQPVGVQPAQPAPPPPNTAPPATVGGIPLPMLGGCDPRGHGLAIASYLDKIRAAMEEIRAGLKPANNLFGSCKIFPTSVRNSCCNTFKTEAAKRCKEGVLAKAAQDPECSLKPVNCRMIRPLQCTIKKVTERKRAECCRSLAPQGRAELLAYCDTAVEQIAAGCEVAQAPTPSVEFPISIPQQPEAPVTQPLEPVTTVIPDDPTGKVPEQVTE